MRFCCLMSLHACVYVCDMFMYMLGIHTIKYIMYSVLQTHYKIHIASIFKDLTFPGRI